MGTQGLNLDLDEQGRPKVQFPLQAQLGGGMPPVAPVLPSLSKPIQQQAQPIVSSSIPPVTTGNPTPEDNAVTNARTKLDTAEHTPSASQGLWNKAGEYHKEHPGFMGRIAQVGAGILRGVDIAGESIMPGAARMIPGSIVNQQQQVETAKKGVKEAEAERNTAAEASLRKTQEGAIPGEIDERKAQTRDLNAQSAQREHDLANPKVEPPKHIDDYINDKGQKVEVMQKADGSTEEVIGGMTQPPADANKLAGEIAAQVGPQPTTAEYAGKKYSSVGEAQKAWGHAAEGIKNREAAAGAAARGQAFGQYRPVQAIDPETGNLTYMYAGNAISQGAAPAGAGAQAMSKDAQIKDIQSASGKARNAISNLDKPFDPAQIGKLTLALHQDDPGVFKTEVATLLGSEQLTPAQQDFVVWIAQLNERALSLRSIAGMGQGASDLRNAIRATLPGVRSGSKEMALKQLDAFDNMVGVLSQGIPKVNHPAAGGQKQAYQKDGKWYDASTQQEIK